LIANSTSALLQRSLEWDDATLVFMLRLSAHRCQACQQPAARMSWRYGSPLDLRTAQPASQTGSKLPRKLIFVRGLKPLLVWHGRRTTHPCHLLHPCWSPVRI